MTTDQATQAALLTDEPFPEAENGHSPSSATTGLGLRHSLTRRATEFVRANARLVAGVYCLGASLMLLRLLIAICGGRRLAASGRALDASALLDALSDQARQPGVPMQPVAAVCERVTVPVGGIIRPIILLPASLTTGLPILDLSAGLAPDISGEFRSLGQCL